MPESVIRPVDDQHLQQALNLVWEVFCEFEAPEYSEEGVEEFRRYIQYQPIKEMLGAGEMRMWGCYYGINGDVIAVYAETQDSAGSEEGILSQAAYSYQGAVVDGSGRAWDCFTTDEDAVYTVFLLLEAEADLPGETMVHFHFRYGNDVEELLAQDGWHPTMTAYDSTHDLIVGHMLFDD